MENIWHRSITMIIILFVVLMLCAGIFYFFHSKYTLENQYMSSFDDSVMNLNESMIAFFSTFESGLEMFSQNEMIQKVTDYPEMYYLPVMDLFKSFQESYSFTAFAYFGPKEIILENKKLITWPDTSEALADEDWIATKRPWYINAIKAKGNIAWTKPYLDATTKRPTITISKIVKDKEGEIKGVIAIDFFLDMLANKVENFKAFKQGNVFIIHKEKEEDYVFIVQDQENGNFDFILNETWMEDVFRNNKGGFNFYKGNKSYYASYATNSNTGWKTLGIIEGEKLYKNSRDMMKEIFAIGVWILLVGIAIIVYISKQMTKSIKDFSKTFIYQEEDKGEDLLSNKFDILLSQEGNYRELIDASNLPINLLFESEAYMEKLLQIQNNSGVELSQEEIDEMEIILDKLIELMIHFDKNTMGTYQIQKENIQNHIDMALEKIRYRKEKIKDTNIIKRLNKLEEKIIIKVR